MDKYPCTRGWSDPERLPLATEADGDPPMRVWFDCTAAAHPVVLRPVIERFRLAVTRSWSPPVRTGRRSATSSGSAFRIW